MAKKKNNEGVFFPRWFDGKTINEARFCEDFLQTHRIVFANGAFFTPDGRVTDDLSGKWEKNPSPSLIE